MQVDPPHSNEGGHPWLLFLPRCRYAEETFKWDSDDIVGQNVSPAGFSLEPPWANSLSRLVLSSYHYPQIKVLMKPQDAAPHDDHLRRYRKTRVPHVVGSQRVVDAVASDGETIRVMLRVNEINLNGNLSFVGILHVLDKFKRVQIEEVGLRLPTARVRVLHGVNVWWVCLWATQLQASPWPPSSQATSGSSLILRPRALLLLAERR